MKLNNFKQCPLSILSFLFLTLFSSYLITASVEIAVVTTVLSTWICLMPRLTHENALYKLPKFLSNHDMINKIISGLVPICLLVVYANSVKSSTVFGNSIIGLLLICIPFVFAFVQYLLIKNGANSSDLIIPFATAIFSFIATQIITGTFVSTIKMMFPFFFGMSVSPIQLWGIFFEILFIYGLYGIFSLIIPSRTASATITSFFVVLFSLFQKLYAVNFGFSFKISDITSVDKLKRFVAILKILFTENIQTTVLIIAVLSIVIITLIVKWLGNWSTTYNLVKRFKQFAISALSIALCILGFNFMISFSQTTSQPLYAGPAFVLYTESKNQNTFSEDIEQKINQVMNDMGLNKDKTQEGQGGTNPTTGNPMVDNANDFANDVKDGMGEAVGALEQGASNATTPTPSN